MAAFPAFVTPAEYLEREAKASCKHEYVRGRIYAMAGASRDHNEIFMNLGALLRNILDGSTCRNLGSDVKVWVDREQVYFYPDATISCPPNYISDSKGVIDNPTVIFEILSESTAVLDEGTKFAMYEQLPSLRDYVLIDSRKQFVKVFSLEGGQWLAREYAEDSDSALVPSLGISLALSELYKFATFTDIEQWPVQKRPERATATSPGA